MSRGIKQTTAVNRKVVNIQGHEVVRCWDCFRLQQRVCMETGQPVKYPISGPIPDFCTMPFVRFEDE